MRVLIPVLLATTAFVPGEAYASEGGGNAAAEKMKSRFCEDSQNGRSTNWLSDCRSLRVHLVNAEAELKKKKERRSNSLTECKKLAAQINDADPLANYFSLVENAKESVHPKGKNYVTAVVLPVNCENSPPVDSPKKAMVDTGQYDRFLKARTKYLAESDEANVYSIRFKDALAHFDRQVLQAGAGIGKAPPNDNKEGHTRVVSLALGPPGASGDPTSLEECKINYTAAEAPGIKLLDSPRDCIILAQSAAVPPSIEQGTKALRRTKGPKIQSSLATGKSGSNASITLKGTLSRFDARFDKVSENGEQRERRPKNLTYSVGVEAKANDGIADIIGGNSQDANFFSLDRLSSTFLIKGSLGMNFFPRQSEKEFEESRQSFLKKAKEACFTSLAAGKTKVATNCDDANLMAWIYELDKRNYARKELVEEFEKLIWQSSKEYPQFGGGLTGSLGLRDRNFHRFSDADRNFDPGLVDVENFFSKESGVKSARAGRLNDEPAYTLGGYTYFHIPTGKSAKIFEGFTARLDALLKHDLEDLSGKEVEICQTDLANVTMSDVFLAGDRCKTTLPFEPRFKDNAVGKFELRIGTKAQDFFPAMGFAPNVSYEFRDGQKDKMRFELPVYFSGDGKVLNGGFGVAYEVDYARARSKSGTSVFIFVGKEFSLDGSKSR